MAAEQVADVLKSFRGRRLLVTGGHGFLGRWVVEQARAQLAHVVVIDRSPKAPALSDVTLVEEDIVSSGALEKLVGESDLVIHLAGSLGTEGTFSSLASTAQNNVVGTARIIECCLSVGRRAVIPTVGNDWLNPYTITRRCAADLAIMANQECGGDLRVLKVMNAYGPWQRFDHARKIIPSFFRQCLLGEPIDIYGDGNQCIDLIHAKDVACAILLAGKVDRPLAASPIEVGTCIPTRVSEVARLVQEITGSTSGVRYLGKRMGEPLHSMTMARDDVLKRVAGFVPTILLETGLRATLDWYRAHPGFLKIEAAALIE